MSKQLLTWKWIAQNLEQQVGVMLLYVLESSGSSPGRQGFFMGVNAEGQMEGSVGGGIMEHKFVEMAKSKLKDGRPESGVRRQVHDKSAAKDQSGMICSGEQTVLLYTLQENEAVIIQRLIVSLKNHKNGTLALSPRGIQFNEAVPLTDFEFTYHSDKDWLYKEKTGYKNSLFIIGGGHCALALSRIMQPMDFYTRMYDDRKELKTMVENEWVHEKHLLNDYGELNRLVARGNNQYLVIMTFGYRTDDRALRAVLDKPFNYLAVLGSRNKMEKLFRDYREEGIAEDNLQRIHTPAGLAIKSQTPEEIAVSIAAEIIKVKNQQL